MTNLQHGCTTGLGNLYGAWGRSRKELAAQWQIVQRAEGRAEDRAREVDRSVTQGGSGT